MDEKASGFMFCVTPGIPHKYVTIYKNPEGKYYASIDFYRSTMTFDHLNDTTAMWKCVDEVRDFIIEMKKLCDAHQKGNTGGPESSLREPSKEV